MTNAYLSKFIAESVVLIPVQVHYHGSHAHKRSFKPCDEKLKEKQEGAG